MELPADRFLAELLAYCFPESVFDARYTVYVLVVKYAHACMQRATHMHAHVHVHSLHTQ